MITKKKGKNKNKGIRVTVTVSSEKLETTIRNESEWIGWMDDENER
jgi:hypothetical protein